MSFGSPYLTLPDFSYYKAKTLEEALDILEQKEGSARILAGGVGIISFMKERLVTATDLVDIKGIKELKGVSLESDSVRIGSCTTLQEISENSLIESKLGALYQASRNAADIAIRNRATVGGNVCEAIPWVDIPVALIALDSTINITSKKGKREMKVESFLKGMFETDLKQDEIVTHFKVPLHSLRSTFMKFSKGSEFAIASVAIGIGDRGSRIVFGSVAEKPVRCREVEEIIDKEGITEHSIRKAMKQARESVECMDDVLASSEYRKQIVSILTVNALKEVQK
jgi:carbon-monoxide dehydrogenase medium subunit